MKRALISVALLLALAVSVPGAFAAAAPAASAVPAALTAQAGFAAWLQATTVSASTRATGSSQSFSQPIGCAPVFCRLCQQAGKQCSFDPDTLACTCALVT
jgi:hypothetical protein